MASQSYLAESYLVLAVHILLLPEDGLFFLPCSPLSSGNVAWPRGGQPVSSVGSSGEAGKEKINSGCLDFLARPERGDLPGSFPYMARLLWAGSLLQAPPPPAVSAGGGPLLVTWDSGAVEAGQGSRRRAGPRTCPCGPCTNWPAIVALGCLG